MRVLAIASLFPSVVRPTKGIFVSKQLAGIAHLCDKVRVVSPVPWAPSIFHRNPAWKAYAQTPATGVVAGVDVSYPRYLQLPGRWYYPYSGKAVFWGIRSEIARVIQSQGRFDVVHGNFGLPDGEAAVNVGRWLGIPSVVTLRGSDIHTAPQWSRAAFTATRWVLNNATKVVAVSDGLRRVALDIACPAAGIEVVHTGTDLQEFCPGDAGINRVRLGLPMGRLLCLYVGSLEPDKGVFELLRAFGDVSQRIPDVDLMLVGDGPSRDELKRLAAALALDDRVIFRGSVVHAEIATWMVAADLVILPSHAEGLPNVLVEAAACGRPVVATPVGGIPEIVQDGSTGLLVPVRDQQALGVAIGRILDRDDRGQAMGEAAREFVTSRFSWDINAGRYLQVYRAAVEEFQLRRTHRHDP